MKRTATLLCSLAFLFFMTCTVTYGAEVIKLKSANYLPPTHKMSLLGQKFCDEVNKRSNGRVKLPTTPEAQSFHR
jgi:TRAP-type C4-dicarboxylate transport system substrate-binding protein